MKTTFSKAFYLRKSQPKKNGNVIIEVKISISGKKTHFSTGMDVHPSLWLQASGRIKGNDAHSRLINHRLDRLMDEIDSCYYQLLKEQGYVYPSQIRELILQRRNRAFTQVEERQEVRKNFFDYFDELNDILKTQISAKSYSRYIATRKRFAEYFTKVTKKKPQQIAFTDLTPTLINGFYPELISRYRIANNMAMKYMQRLKRATTYAMGEEKFKDPFRMFKFHFDEADRDFLTVEEIMKLMQKKFVSKRLELVRDMFVFSCFTGFSFAEMCSLTKEDIHKAFDGSLWIIDRRKKTKNQFKVRLMEIPRGILQKYEGVSRSDKLLPMKSNTKMNEYLEEIRERCGIQDKITFHCARHRTLSFGL